MKKRVLMSSIAASVLAGMFVLSGCGGSSSTISDVADSSGAKPSTNTPVTNKPDTNKPAEDEKKASLDTRCATLTYVGEVANVKVEALDENGKVIGTATTDSKGEYCFNGEPFQIKVAGNGSDSELNRGISCSQDALDFVEGEKTDCYPISNFHELSSPLHSLNRAKQFRSFMGDVYEQMDVDFAVYDKAVLEALSMSSIIDIEKKLLNIHPTKDTNLSAGQKNIIENIIDLTTSNSSEDVVSLAMFAFLDNAAKIKAENSDANKTGLFDGDGNVTQWINENRLMIEEYINKNTPEDEKNRAVDTNVTVAGINLKIFATMLVEKIKDGTFKAGTPALLTALESAIPAASLGEHYLETSYIACGPLSEYITMDAKFTNKEMEFTNISNIRCENGCETVYPSYLDGNKSAVVQDLVVNKKAIEFNSKGLELTTAQQYAHIIESTKDLLTLKLNFDMNKSVAIDSKNLLATVILDVPNACAGDDKSKDEYLALSFKVVPTFDETNTTGSFVIPADSDVVFASKIKKVTKVVDGDDVVTYPALVASTKNVSEDNSSFVVENGVMDLDVITLLNIAMAKAESDSNVTIGNIKDLIVRAVSNVDGDPTMLKATISLIDMDKVDSAVASSNFIVNGSTFDPHAYKLDGDSSAYHDTFDKMSDADVAVKAITIKTCFGGSDDD